MSSSCPRHYSHRAMAKILPKPFRWHLRPFLSIHSIRLKYASGFLLEFSSSTPQEGLSEEEQTTINLLIPRLCFYNQLNTAIHLTITALRLSPPSKPPSFPILIHFLTAEPDLARPMALLTRLRHTQTAHSHLTPITSLLINSYLRKGRPRDALKIYYWVRRPGSVCEPEPGVYGVLVNGLCKHALVLEGLRVLRDMLLAGFVPADGLRRRLFTSLLREARVKEAKNLNEVLGRVIGGGEEGIKRVLALLDQITFYWTD